MPREYTKRLSIPIEAGMKTRLNTTIPDGVRAAFLRAIVEISLDAIETNGPNMLGVILNGAKFIKLTARDVPKM